MSFQKNVRYASLENNDVQTKNRVRYFILKLRTLFFVVDIKFVMKGGFSYRCLSASALDDDIHESSFDDDDLDDIHAQKMSLHALIFQGQFLDLLIAC